MNNYGANEVIDFDNDRGEAGNYSAILQAIINNEDYKKIAKQKAEQYQSQEKKDKTISTIGFAVFVLSLITMMTCLGIMFSGSFAAGVVSFVMLIPTVVAFNVGIFFRDNVITKRKNKNLAISQGDILFYLGKDLKKWSEANYKINPHSDIFEKGRRKLAKYFPSGEQRDLFNRDYLQLILGYTQEKETDLADAKVKSQMYLAGQEIRVLTNPYDNRKKNRKH